MPKSNKPVASKVSKSPAKLAHMSNSEYNGQPMIVFGEPNDRFPFQFGGGKAAKILRAMAANGVDAVIAELGKIANGTLSDEDRAVLGLPRTGKAK
jgi:hypothetical protein